MARARGARSLLYAAIEDTYGVSPAGGFRRFPFTQVDIDGSQELLQSELLGYGRDPLAPELDALNVDGTLVVPVTVDGIGFWLRALLGDPVTTGTGPYTHVFRSGSWNLPSLSIETGMPDVPLYSMVRGVRINQMEINLMRSGHITASLSVRGRDEAAGRTTSGAGPLLDPYDDVESMKRFLQRHGRITRAEPPEAPVTLANVESAKITYSNNLDAIEVIGDGGKIADADASMATATLELVVRFADTVLLDQALNGAPAAFAYRLTRGDDSLVFVFQRLYLPHPRKAITGPNGVMVTFSGIAAQQTSGGPMFSATLTNSVETYV